MCPLRTWMATLAILLQLSHLAHSSSYKELLPKTIWSSDNAVGNLDHKGTKILFRQRDFAAVANITSLATHVEDNLLFLADSAGTIRRFEIEFDNRTNYANNLKKRHVIKLMTRNNDYVNLTSVTQLCVDWLNRMLYIVSGDGKIHRSNFNGERFQTLIEGFEVESSGGPFNLQVDPVNGYLLYSLKGDRKGGIYRVGLSEFRDQMVKTTNSRGKKRNTVDFTTPKHFESIARFIAHANMSIFTVEPLTGSVIYPRANNDSIEMVSVSLDGKHVSVIRPHSEIQTTRFTDGPFKKLAYIGGLFQWVIDETIYVEERMDTKRLHGFQGYDSIRPYHHMSVQAPPICQNLTSVACFTEQLQPYPEASTPVQEISAIFQPNRARVTWKKPPPKTDQDSSAWQGWEYELSIHRADSSEQNHTQNGLKEPTSVIVDLTPDTEYLIKVRPYLPGKKPGVWSREYKGRTKPITAPTSSSSPPFASPSPPSITKIDIDNSIIHWSKVEKHGADSLFYQLYLIDSEDDATDEDKWRLEFNGTNNYWFMMNSALDPNRSYRVKVRAISDFGKSNFSSISEIFPYIPATTGPSTSVLPPSARNQEYLIAVFGFLALFFVALVAVTCILSTKKRKDDGSCLDDHKKGLNELVSLPELPPHSHQTNVLYMPGFSVADELAMIPHIRTEQIEKAKQLGEGAFGTVYEGYVHRLWGPSSGKTKVAIKTLPNIPRKQASIDFLKEAKLMANFNHPHILRLMAVCVDNNSFINALVLELMEGGDLKRYVANNRPTPTTASKLTMADLLSICVDVAKGCKYLEDMHFIHRDIAARNCLVSSSDRETRVVKIGDFGLARDVYKSDYYRKGTEALVPCRWMSPESLADGKFTTQCDIWAFGVLMWEVMTLGEQPYSSLGNTAVLNYVRCGGILGKPEACPPDLYTLMKLCWAFDPNKRPTFAMLLQRLEELASRADFDQNAQITMTSVHNHAYSRNYLLSQKNKSTDDASMASSSEACTSGIYSASLTDSSFKYAQLSLNKQTFCEMNGYSLPSSSSGFGSSVSGNSSPQLSAVIEVSARSKKGRFKRQTLSSASPPSSSHPGQGEVGMMMMTTQCTTSSSGKGGTHVTTRPFSVSLTDSPPPTYSQIFNCTNAPHAPNALATNDHSNHCTGTQLHLDSPDTNDTHYVNQVTHGGQLKTEVPSVVSSGIDTLREEPRQCSSQGAVTGINSYINSSVISSDLLRKNFGPLSAPCNRSLTILSKVNETFPRQQQQQQQHKVVIHNSHDSKEDWSSFDSEVDSSCTSSSSGTSSHLVDSPRESIVVHEYKIPNTAGTIFKSALRSSRVHVANNANHGYNNYNNNNNLVKDDHTCQNVSVKMKQAQLILTRPASRINTKESSCNL